ncbi:hypothetical protein ACP70R_036386 [Stipagrostis hirtigluma subsp. patula]
MNSTASPTVLSYNLTAWLAISNPNRRVSIYYDQLQGTRHTDTVKAVLVGRSPMVGFADEFPGDNSTEVFPVDLWVDGVVRYKFGQLTTTAATTLSVKCHLALQLVVASGWVDCTVVKF